MTRCGWMFGAAAVAMAVPALAAQERNSEASSPAIKGELILFEMQNYNGASVSVMQRRATIRTNWNIRSIAIHPGDRWQLCARPRFRDPCIILDRSVHDASLIGVEGQLGSIRNAAEIQEE